MMMNYDNYDKDESSWMTMTMMLLMMNKGLRAVMWADNTNLPLPWPVVASQLSHMVMVMMTMTMIMTMMTMMTMMIIFFDHVDKEEDNTNHGLWLLPPRSHDDEERLCWRMKYFNSVFNVRHF